MQHAGIRQKKTNLHSLLSVLGKGSEKSALNLYFSSEALPCRELAVWMISLENWIRHQSRGQQKPKHFVVSITSRYLQHDQMLKLRRKKKPKQTNKHTKLVSRYKNVVTGRDTWWSLLVCCHGNCRARRGGELVVLRDSKRWWDWPKHMHAYTDTPWQLKVTDNLALKFD